MTQPGFNRSGDIRTDTLVHSPEFSLWGAVIKLMLADARKPCSKYALKCTRKKECGIILREIDEKPFHEILCIMNINVDKLKKLIVEISNNQCPAHKGINMSWEVVVEKLERKIRTLEATIAKLTEEKLNKPEREKITCETPVCINKPIELPKKRGRPRKQ